MTIGERIRNRRKELGLSADDVAERLGKNRATVYRYESNYIENMPLSVLEPLAEALHTTPTYLMGWDDDPTDYDDPDIVADNAGALLDAFDGDVRMAAAVRKATDEDALNEVFAASSDKESFYEDLPEEARAELDNYKEYLKLKYGKK